MNNILTFVIPVRHQDNARDWRQLKRNLAQTIESIASQDSDGWKCIIVANQGADLPRLPDNFFDIRVDFPPNPLHERGDASQEDHWKALRKDKGRRILAGMLAAGPMGHVMHVDDDDFVSNRLASFVAQHPQANGWYVRDGFLWSEGSRVLYRVSDFSKRSGTSHIIRSDLYELPATMNSASDDYISNMLGSHTFISEHLARMGTPLSPLPFLGAVYRTGHPGAHSRSPNIYRQFLIKKAFLRRPSMFLESLRRFEGKSVKIEKEFFGRKA
jgi:hypothetical protein